MDLKFGYDTYQDVRHNLFLYSTPFLIGAGFFTFFRVLPIQTQQAVVRFLESVSNTQPWKGLLGTGIGVVAFAGAALLLTEIIQIHDQWYDKHIIKWRHQYATDFILPRLIQPWVSRTNYRLFEVADANVRQFQERLYYPYLVLLCYKITISCRIVLWAKRLRQAHRNYALRHISRAWPKPQGMPIVTFR